MAKTFNIRANFKISDGATKVLRSASKALGTLGRQFNHVTAAGSKMTASITKVLAPLTIITGIAGSGFLRGIQSAQEYANAVGDLADRLGVSSKFMQEQHYIAQLSAGSAEEMTSAIETLSRQYGALQAGTGKLYTGLQKISPALANQMKNAKSTEEAFEIMVKAIRKVEDPARKMYLSQLAFGTAGKMMINVSDQSEEALNRLKTQAKDLGVVMEDDAVKSSQDMGEAMDIMNASVRGVFNMFASRLIPVLIPFIKRISEWIRVNKELISTKIDKFVGQFAELLSKIDLEVVLNALSGFASMCLHVTDILAGLNKWILLIGVALASGAICNMIAFGKSLGTLLWMIPGVSSAVKVLSGMFIKLGLAILSTPIGWIALGIAGIVAAFALLWNKCEGFRNFWIRLWGGIKSAFKTVADFIIGMIDAILNPIETLMKGINAVKNAGGWIADKLGFGDDEDDEKESPKPKIKGNNQDRKSQSDEDIESYPDYQRPKQYVAPSESSPLPSNTMTSQEPMKLAQVYTPYPQATGQTQSHSEVVVKFDNLPKEASVEKVSKDNNTDLGVEYGYALGGA